MNTFDLQIQSIASDGKHAPSEIVAMAAADGVSILSLTDHDTVAGVGEAVIKGEEAGVRVIPGIEMSVEEHNLHILGYGIDIRHPELLAALGDFKKSRIDGARKIVENLKANEGLAIEWADVEKEAENSSTVTRPHIVSAVMKKPENKKKLEADGVRDKNGFFEKYLLDTGRNFVSRAHISARDAIALIHSARGVAVWSHPVIPDFTGGKYDELEKFLESLLSWELDGLEVFSASHSEDDAEFLYGLTEKYRVLKTGGSDFHERGEHPRRADGLHSADRIGDFETYGFPTGDITTRLFEAIARRGV